MYFTSHASHSGMIYDDFTRKSFTFWFFFAFHPVDHKDSFRACFHCMEANIGKLNSIFSMLAVKRSVGVAPEVT